MVNESFSYESLPGRKASTRIYCFTGPLVLNAMFDLQDQLNKERHTVTYLRHLWRPLDGLLWPCVLINCHVSASRRGGEVVTAEASNRILDLFKITRADRVFTLAPAIEEAEALA